jgi:hypothetical protein
MQILLPADSPLDLHSWRRLRSALTDVSAPFARDDGSKTLVESYFPIARRRYQVVGYTLTEDSDSISFVPKISDGMVFAGVNIIPAEAVALGRCRRIGTQPPCRLRSGPFCSVRDQVPASGCIPCPLRARVRRLASPAPETCRRPCIGFDLCSAGKTDIELSAVSEGFVVRIFDVVDND